MVNPFTWVGSIRSVYKINVNIVDLVFRGFEIYNNEETHSLPHLSIAFCNYYKKFSVEKYVYCHNMLVISAYFDTSTVIHHHPSYIWFSSCLEKGTMLSVWHLIQKLLLRTHGCAQGRRRFFMMGPFCCPCTK